MALPTKEQCRARTAYYVRTGRLKKADACEKCGTVGPVEAHHKRYDDPLDVDWWCKHCHVVQANQKRKGRKYRKVKFLGKPYSKERARQLKQGDIPGQLLL